MADILIADDDPILVEILKFHLEAAGHSVSAAGDGEAALEAARANPPALVVLDSIMPRMAGPEVLAQLKADQTLRDIPVVMLSARDSEADVVAGFEGGAAEYLTKPFVPQDLLVRIDRLLAEA